MIRALAIAALLIASSAPPVAAQMVCGSYDSMKAKLESVYGETRRGAGIGASTAIFEVWASEVTGSWTILRVLSNGIACLVAAGDNWREYPPETPGDDA